MYPWLHLADDEEIKTWKGQPTYWPLVPKLVRAKIRNQKAASLWRGFLLYILKAEG